MENIGNMNNEDGGHLFWHIEKHGGKGGSAKICPMRWEEVRLPVPICRLKLIFAIILQGAS